VATLVAWLVDGELSGVRALSSRVSGSKVLSRWGVAALCGLYGAVAGGLFLVLQLYALGLLPVPPTVVEAVVAGVGQAAVLTGVWLLVVRVVGGISWGGATGRWLLVYHAVYGVAFAGWTRFTWIT